MPTCHPTDNYGGAAVSARSVAEEVTHRPGVPRLDHTVEGRKGVVTSISPPGPVMKDGKRRNHRTADLNNKVRALVRPVIDYKKLASALLGTHETSCDTRPTKIPRQPRADSLREAGAEYLPERGLGVRRCS